MKIKKNTTDKKKQFKIIQQTRVSALERPFHLIARGDLEKLYGLLK
jgi:hypothetical protein